MSPSVAEQRAEAAYNLGLHASTYALVELDGQLIIHTGTGPGMDVRDIPRLGNHYKQLAVSLNLNKTMLSKLREKLTDVTNTLAEVLVQRNAATYKIERWEKAWAELRQWDSTVGYMMDDLVRKHDLKG